MSWFRLLPELLNPVGSPQTRSSPRKAPNVIPNKTEEGEDDDDRPLITFDDFTRVSTNQQFDSFLVKKKKAKHRFSGHISAENCHTLLQEVLHLTVISQLGTGCFGTGFSVQRPTDQQEKPLVCKTYMFGRNYDYRRTSGVFGEYRANRLVTFQREVSLYKQLSHPNIVTYHSAFQIFSQLGGDSALELLIDNFEQQTGESTEKQLLISGLLIEQLDYTLERYLSLHFPNQRPPPEIIESIFLQIGAALVYLHRDLSVAHLDLKADNIGVTLDRQGDYTLKLFDFGNSKRFSPLLYEAAEAHSLVEAEAVNQIQAEAVENPFLRESATFANLIMSQATSCKLIDLDETSTFLNGPPSSLAEETLKPRSKFELTFHGNEKLKRIFLAMVPEVGFNCSTVQSGRVTVNWALMEYQKKEDHRGNDFEAQFI